MAQEDEVKYIEAQALARIMRLGVKSYDIDYEFTSDEKRALVLIAARARERGEAALAGLTIYKVFVGASLDGRASTDKTIAALRRSEAGSPRGAHSNGHKE